MRAENKRITDDRASDEAAFKEILDQQEYEYEDELRQLISAAEGELIMERENISKLRTLVQTKNTKLDQLKKKLVELSMASKARATLLNNEKNEKKKLLETIEHYKKNLAERGRRWWLRRRRLSWSCVLRQELWRISASYSTIGCSSSRRNEVPLHRILRVWSATSPPCMRS